MEILTFSLMGDRGGPVRSYPAVLFCFHNLWGEKYPKDFTIQRLGLIRSFKLQYNIMRKKQVDH